MSGNSNEPVLLSVKPKLQKPIMESVIQLRSAKSLHHLKKKTDKNGTLIPKEPFIPEYIDCVLLQKAIKGFGK